MGRSSAGFRAGWSLDPERSAAARFLPIRGGQKCATGSTPTSSSAKSFRPFAPAVLEDRLAEHFDHDHPSPFMLETCPVVSPFELPAVTHVDGSARVQTVDIENNRRFALLLDAFFRRTGCPILLNTSFNMRGQPIVCTPVDAIVCFLQSKLDCLVLEDFLIDRNGVPDAWLEWYGHGDQNFDRMVPTTVYTFL